MRRMIIVGAGGLGREVESLARRDRANGTEWTLAGFLDTRENVLAGISMDAGVIGDPNTYVPRADDMFIVAIGDPKFKRKLVAPLRLKGATFVSLRTSVRMADRVRYGAAVFGDCARISVDTTIGDYVFIGDDCVIGHDVEIADYAHIGTRCFIAGNARIEEDALVHPMSSIAIGVRVGKGATVGLGSVVFHDVPDSTTVIGNPARRLERSRN
jgi:sugar O-acyltransferase (sialic acid O-acetyltransferase NeuD family)